MKPTHTYLKQLSRYTRKLDQLNATEVVTRTVSRRRTMFARRIRQLLHLLVGWVPSFPLSKAFAAASVALSLALGVSGQAFKPVQVNPFGLTPATYFALPASGDLDNDGDIDLLVGEDYGNLKYYQNTGTASSPAFAAPVQNPFGFAPAWYLTIPKLADLDNDGDLDLLVSSYDSYYDAVFYYYENTGTPSSPSFGSPQANPFGLTPYSSDLAWPDLADLDNDGDLDMLVTQDGAFVYYENTGTASSPSFASPQVNPFALSYSYGLALSFADVDGDGDLDLIAGDIGYSQGEVYLYLNTGTSSAPSFASPIPIPGVVGYSFAIPDVMDLDNDGDLDVLVGVFYGNLYYYENATAVNDLGISGILSPMGNCGLGSAEQVSVEVKNYGTNPQNSFDLSYSINGGPAATESVSSLLLPGQSMTYTFTSTADMSSVGGYDLKSWTTLAGDPNGFNDADSVIIQHKQVVTVFPYEEDFESGPGGWHSAGTNSTWELGTPNNLMINSAASGQNAWVTNLDGNYRNDELSMVISPCFDFTNVDTGRIELMINRVTEAFNDGAAVLYSVNQGATWQRVGNAFDPDNWYNSDVIEGLFPVTQGEGWDDYSFGWLQAGHDLPVSLSGQPSVMFAVVFGSDDSDIDEGFAFDDFKVINKPTIPNQLPTAASKTITISQDGSYTFSASDFGYSDPDSDPMDHIRITKLEANGSLTWYGSDVTLNQNIAAGQISLLQFAPQSGQSGSPYDNFEFRVNDGIAYSAQSYTITINVSPVGIDPVFGERIAVHPVPADDQLVISGLIGTATLMELLDIQGRVVKTTGDFLRSGEIYNLDVSNLPSGLYTVKVSNGENVKVVKVIVI